MVHTKDTSRPYSAVRNNARHFLTRNRLDDEELAEWITAAVGNDTAFKALPKDEAVKMFTAYFDEKSREIFGSEMGVRSMGGIALLVSVMVSNIEKAQDHSFTVQTMPQQLKNAYALVKSLELVAKDESLSGAGLNALRSGGKIMDDLADYARDAALVLPFTRGHEEHRDRILSMSRGMPAVDIKLSGIVREYNEHLRNSIPSWSLTGRVG